MPIAAVGAIVSAGAGIIGSRQAAKAQESATNRALESSEGQYIQDRIDLAPYRQAGLNATAAIQAELGLSSTPYFAPDGLNSVDSETGDIAGVRYNVGSGQTYSGGINQSTPSITNAAGVPLFGANVNTPAPNQGPRSAIAILRGDPDGDIDQEIARLQNIGFIEKGDNGADRVQANLTELARLQEIKKYGSGQAQNAQQVQQQPTGTPGIKYQGFQATPGYQFRLDQGNRSLTNRLAAAGLAGSGNAVQAAIDYNQGVASNEYGNYFARLQSAAGQGQTATNTTAQLGANFANNASNLIQAGGEAQASGYRGVANAITGGIGNLADVAGFANSQGYFS